MKNAMHDDGTDGILTKALLVILVIFALMFLLGNCAVALG